MFIRSQTTTLHQIFCELLLCSEVIFKSVRVADVRLYWSYKCEWANEVFLSLSMVNRLYVARKDYITQLPSFPYRWFSIVINKTRYKAKENLNFWASH